MAAIRKLLLTGFRKNEARREADAHDQQHEELDEQHGDAHYELDEDMREPTRTCLRPGNMRSYFTICSKSMTLPTTSWNESISGSIDATHGSVAIGTMAITGIYPSHVEATG